jgi:hypothetical protein
MCLSGATRKYKTKSKHPCQCNPFMCKLSKGTRYTKHEAQILAATAVAIQHARTSITYSIKPPMKTCSSQGCKARARQLLQPHALKAYAVSDSCGCTPDAPMLQLQRPHTTVQPSAAAIPQHLHTRLTQKGG